MSRDIKESDWKFLRQLHPVALERFAQRVLSEMEGIVADAAKSAHQRYLDIYAVIKRRDREIALIFDDLRRSTALTKIAAIRVRGLITEEEFLRFSQETRNIVDVFLQH